MLFGALVPPPMRKAKSDFAVALEHAIAAANVAHRISLAEAEIRVRFPRLASPRAQGQEEKAGGAFDASREKGVASGASAVALGSS